MTPSVPTAATPVSGQAMEISLEHPDQPEVMSLIDALDAFQKPLYPPESHHGIDLEALRQSNVRFAVVRTAAGEAIACGAVVLGEEFAELKRMFVRPEHRGQGIAKALLEFLEEQARAHGCRDLMLETGISQPEALRLYERSGYVSREPFGDYAPDPYSVFLHKRIVP